MSVTLGAGKIKVGDKNIAIPNYELLSTTTSPVVPLLDIDSNYKYMAFTYNGYLTLATDATNLVAWYKCENYKDSTSNNFHMTGYYGGNMYPPVRNFTSATTVVSGQTHGNGTYNVTYSSGLNELSPYTLFNTGANSGGHWADGVNYTAGVYNGTQSFDGGTYKGEWVIIQMPVSIKLTKYSFLQRNGFSARAPNDFKIYGSNNNTTWDVLVDKRSITYTGLTYNETVNVDNYYTYYLLVVYKLVGNTAVTLNFDEWYIYGDEKIESTALHFANTISTDNGVLNNPYLLLHNTISNYVVIPSSLNIYNVYNNALTIGGSQIGITFTLWFKATGGASFARILDFSNNAIGTSATSYVYINKDSDSTNITFIILNSVYKTTGINFYDGTWRHIAWSIASDNKWYIYINGIVVSNGAITQAVPNTTYIRQFIGKSGNGDGYNIGGGIQDFRIYNTALTSTEVLALFNTSKQTSYIVDFSQSTICDILVVGGGGGGGQQNAGGGGAGGLVLIQNFQANGSYTINIGKGGAGGNGYGGNGSAGNNTTFVKSDNSVIITANGGGGGGGGAAWMPITATNGGSGGGGGWSSANGTQTQKSQTQIGIVSPVILNQFGENGGHGGGDGSSYPGGGGGGAGGSGATSASNTSGQNGGSGIDRVGTFIFSEKFASSIGDNGWFAGGGGSGGDDGSNDGYGNGGNGLYGGGGNGDGIGRGIHGINGTGGGGGSIRNPSTVLGGNGGSGIVIIRYLTSTPQWTYNSLNANTYYLGNVGIGTIAPKYNLHVVGETYSTTYSGGSKSFMINHPLNNNKMLYHGCVEGPRFDNIYRGKTMIMNGICEVNIDMECNTTGGMTQGTFVRLNTNPQLFLRNNMSFDKVKGKINGNIIKIECENTIDEIEVEWLVIGERCDRHVIDTRITNAEGRLICEHDI
jgi:hypothetical protein